jgi:hypothetical protein
MTRLVLAMCRLMELFTWNRRPFMSASVLEMVDYTMQCVVKALAEAPHWQIIETYWNTRFQQNNFWSIAFMARKKEIFKEVCPIIAPGWILHTQTGTKFMYKSVRLNPILFHHQETTMHSIMISTALNPPHSVWNSLISFWKTISIFSSSRACGCWCTGTKCNAERVES